jgi:hypothetical protein
MSAAVNIPGVRFVVCGGDDHERLRHEADALDKSDRFIVTGPVDDVSSRLCTFDVFGYPLQPDHYGTGEQAIVEAMAAGLPVVVFNNGPERYIIDHNKTGLIVTSEQEYVAAIETLHRHPQLRRSLGEAARMAARERFSIEVMIDEWNTLFNALIKQSKKEHRWTADIPCSGALLYLESLGNAAVPFALSMTSTEGTIQRKVDKVIADLGGLFRSRTRGSPFHYFSVFNDDPYLKKWCTLIENACVRDGSER